jgi:hypothetical protein
MRDPDERPSGERDPIDQMVHMQKKMARSWAMYVVGCIDRLQNGNLEAGPWLKSYRHYATATTEQLSKTLEALFQLRGPR